MGEFPAAETKYRNEALARLDRADSARAHLDYAHAALGTARASAVAAGRDAFAADRGFLSDAISLEADALFESWMRELTRA